MFPSTSLGISVQNHSPGMTTSHNNVLVKCYTQIFYLLEGVPLILTYSFKSNLSCKSPYKSSEIWCHAFYNGKGNFLGIYAVFSYLIYLSLKISVGICYLASSYLSRIILRDVRKVSWHTTLLFQRESLFFNTLLPLVLLPFCIF